MSNNKLEGRYQAKSTTVTFCEIGKNDSPAIEIAFKPYAELVGADWVIGDFPVVRKLYWLGDKVGAKGKTALEVTKDQMKETYGYAGGFAPDDMSAGMAGKEVEISCKVNDKGYTEVEYVNAPGGRKGGFKHKPISGDKLAQLAARWAGNTVVEKHADPAELFKSMTEGAA